MPGASAVHAQAAWPEAEIRHDGPATTLSTVMCPVMCLIMPAARMSLLAALLVPLACFALLVGSASAEGPRWVAGPPYFARSGVSVFWYTNTPQYFTDPADLSPYVDHAAADALVAAAANIWNVPTSALTLAQGGQLAEHISSLNVYPGPSGLIFPADVSATNYATVQIAVVYDSDGSVTDLLLGQGASDPAECTQSGVTESVDTITHQGTIQHAIVILNGRCTGPDPNQQLQLEYQLVRVFGRVLGLGWSQANDNVFTGYPAPTNFQALNWPIMHPIDVICGSFTYLCQPSPFTLRPDDVGSISGLYPISPGSVPPGKSATLARADVIAGIVSFPNGQGMQGINLTVRRHLFASLYDDPGDIVSTVSGMDFRWNNGNVVTGQLPTPTTSALVSADMGFAAPNLEGFFVFTYIPIMNGQVIDDAIITGQPINPLYSGIHAVGPYQSGPVAPSGNFSVTVNGVRAYQGSYYQLPATGAADNCSTTGQGTASAPAPVDPTGFWTGALCSYGNVAWPMLPVAANRTFTLEITALDAASNPTTTKLQPVIGVWNMTDPTNTVPTVAASPSPFNAPAPGMTSLTAATTSAATLRLAIADDRGDGRPDFTYRARLFYAASVLPSSIPASGGLITITGMGFRPGCQLTINGVPAAVLSTTANTLLAIAPPFAELNSGSMTALDLVLTDPSTGASSTMLAALTYPASAIPTSAESISALTPQIYIPAGLPVSVVEQAVVTAASAAVPGISTRWSRDSADPITFSNAALTLPFTPTFAAPTDQQGVAAVTATVGPLAAAATATGLACLSAPNLCTSFAAVAVDPSQWTATPLLNAQQTVSTNGVLLPVLARITDLAGHPIVGAPAIAYQTVTAYEPACPPTGACPVPPTLADTQTPLVSDSNGLVTIQPLQFGQSPQTLHLALSTGTQSLLALTLHKTP